MKKPKKTEPGTAMEPAGKVEKSLVPGYIQRGNAEGLENVEPTDIVLPRIKLMQALSPDAVSGKFKAGDMVNSLTGKKYPEFIEFIPILHFKSRMFWQDRDDGQGILCSSKDGRKPEDLNAPLKIAKKLKVLNFPKCINACAECPFSKFDEEEDDDKKRRPKCTVYHNFPILIKGEKMPSALAMSRTKLKVGKTLLSLAMTAGDAVPIYSMCYKLSTRLEKNDKFSYYNYVIEPNGWVSQDEYQVTAGLNKSYKNMTVRVEVEHPDGDGKKE